ncbi:MAG: hypothetical protein ACE5EL_03695 [Anaerolineae bacterium]
MVEAIHGAILGAVVVGLDYWWFAVADRYAVFLYGHVDMPGSAPATPFDSVTTSRYWMTGFVAAGTVLVLYTAWALLAGAWARRRGVAAAVPRRSRVWLWAMPVVVVGVPAVTMTTNAPTLPMRLAAAATATALAGIGLALLPADLAARRPKHLITVTLYGFGTAMSLWGWRAIELPGRGLMADVPALAIALGSVAAGFAWLVALASVHRRVPPATSGRNRGGQQGLPDGPGRPTPEAILAAGLTWWLLVTPLAHHIFATPREYRYITSGANIYGWGPRVVLSGVAIAWALAVKAPALGGGDRGRGNRPLGHGDGHGAPRGGG